MASEVPHTLNYKGYLKAHGGWVTSLAVGEEIVNKEKKEFLISGSRDRTLIKWDLHGEKNGEEDLEWGRPRKMYTGKLQRRALPNRFSSRSLPLRQ